MSGPSSGNQAEEMGDRAVQDPVRADHVQRTKPDPPHSSQGPLSSIRAAIKRSRSQPQIDHSRDRRRPEITILSAEPLANSSWFPGASGIFTSTPPPPSPRGPESSWLGSIQEDPKPPPSYDQVIKEKTQEGHVARPTAAPRSSACTSSSATQTDPVRAETSASACLGPASGTVKNPPKPPRPSVLKTQREEPSIGESTSATNVSVATENRNDSESCIEPHNTKDSTHSKAVSGQWDGSAKYLDQCLKVPIDSPFTPVDASIPFSDSRPAECPVPLPRFKKTQRKHWTEEGTVQTLVSLGDNGTQMQVTSSHHQDELSSNKYIQDLQQVFGVNDSFFGIDESSECNSTEQSTEADFNMSAIHSQRDITSRIAAFESQKSTEEVVAIQPPKPLPRSGVKPAVSSKPSLASRASFKYSVENTNGELPSALMPQKPLVAARSQKPLPAPRPQHAVKPGGYPYLEGLQETMPSKEPVLPPSRLSIKAKVKSLERQQEEINLRTPPVPAVKTFIESVMPNNHYNAVKSTEEGYYDMPPEDLQEKMPRKEPVLPPSRLSIKAKVKSLEQQENHALGPPVPLGKPIKEPLVPNLNLNNHNSTFLATGNDVHAPSNFIGDLQETIASRVPVLPNARPSIKAKVKGLEQQLKQEDHVLAPLGLGEKPFKETLVPNFNHHHSTFMATEDPLYDTPSDVQETMPSRVAVLPPSHPTPTLPPTKPFKQSPTPNFKQDYPFMATEDEYDGPANFIGDLKETLASNVPVLAPSRPSIKYKVMSLEQQQENSAPAPPVKPFKEPLVPHFNHHNSPFMATEDPYYDQSSDLQETMPSRVAVLPPPRPTPTVPPTKPVKESPTPNFNQESAFMATEDKYHRSSSRAPLRPQQSLDSSSLAYQNKQSTLRRPTTIRVNSMTSRSLSLDTPPALPTQRPVGLKPRPVHQPETWGPAPPSPETSYKGQELTLPPRPIGGKVLPPRPAPAKAGPARPPPPGSSGGAPLLQASRQGVASGAPTPRASTKRGPALPPRPRPGHHLYNKYTLGLPHGIAVCSYNGPNAAELSFQKNDVLVLLEEMDHRTVMCQAGEVSGLVKSCHMKVITPLAPQKDPLPQISNPASSVSGGGLQVQAIYDFDPASPEELGLRAGDVVVMVEQVDEDWYKGTCRGSVGFFPINYVDVLSNSPPPSHKKKKPSATVSGPRCVARFDYESERSDELTFSEGDEIELMEYVGDDWAKGQLGPCVGIFPLNFVQVVEDLPSTATTPQPQTKIALPGLYALPNIQPEAVKPMQAPQTAGPEWAVALYDFNGQTGEDLSFKQGERILVTKHLDTEWWTGRLNGREGVFPRLFVQGQPGQAQSNHQQQRHEAGGSTAKALFQFTADCDEELSLQAGDIITNLESLDDEWFLGSLRGKRALVPKNYVQVLG